MTVQGTYEIHVKTPVGLQQASLSLEVDGAALRGVLNTERGSFEISDGVVNGNDVSFNTKIRTPMGRMKAHITGTVVGDTFTGAAKLPLGSAQIDGTRV